VEGTPGGVRKVCEETHEHKEGLLSLKARGKMMKPIEAFFMRRKSLGSCSSVLQPTRTAEERSGGKKVSKDHGQINRVVRLL